MKGYITREEKTVTVREGWGKKKSDSVDGGALLTKQKWRGFAGWADPAISSRPALIKINQLLSALPKVKTSTVRAICHRLFQRTDVVSLSLIRPATHLRRPTRCLMGSKAYNWTVPLIQGNKITRGFRLADCKDYG